ncbi:molybdate ABC transporter permease subunit [Cyanobacterium sp. uoEpiScrs1]|uniref:molybdate ABC transporter permease subunit n=1 Tax=Cyanobacterium sp. uoEpiScrs1 TaxID=2976343 RepID=UPI002269CDE0|nr:molybdate ABC transporter permease subunit [Cyanobacterium sp. uoEpiScrs1]
MIHLDLSPIWISLKTALTATLIASFCGIIAARWMFNYRGRGKGLIDGLLTAPLVLPPTVTGFVLLLLLGKQGPIGRLLDLLNVSIIFTWYATVIASVVVAFPLMYKTTLGAFKQIDTNLLASARTLRASERRVFWLVLLPLAKPGLIAGILLAFARALGEFGATLMLAGSIPGKTQTIPIAIFFAAESGAMNQALAWVGVVLVLSLSVMGIVNYWSDEQPKRKSKGITSLKQPSSLRENLDPHELGLTWDTANYPVPKAQIELIVDIQKQLPGFLLDVSFRTDGVPLGLLGASGAGKSMILRCITGLETPDSGRIILNGRVLFDSRQKINIPIRERRVGYLFQNYALFPHLTVSQNIAFGLPKGLSASTTRARIKKHLSSVQLDSLSNRYPAELSGGQQQRLALARALASEPEILLLDEPFSALDTYLRDQLEKLLRTSLIRYPGVTLFVTHNLEEAYRVCPNLLILEGGKIIAQGSKRAIFEHPQSFRVAQLTGCKNFSRVIQVSEHKITAIDWGCTLDVFEPITSNLVHVGIRAHQLTFPDIERFSSLHETNIFPCWLTTISETQHRMTLYLKLNCSPTSPYDYHLQVEVLKDKWQQLKDRSFPWRVQLHPQRLLLLQNSSGCHTLEYSPSQLLQLTSEDHSKPKLS